MVALQGGCGDIECSKLQSLEPNKSDARLALKLPAGEPYGAYSNS